jgi:hypothetical protein
MERKRKQLAREKGSLSAAPAVRFKDSTEAPSQADQAKRLLNFHLKDSTPAAALSPKAKKKGGKKKSVPTSLPADLTPSPAAAAPPAHRPAMHRPDVFTYCKTFANGVQNDASYYSGAAASIIDHSYTTFQPPGSPQHNGMPQHQYPPVVSQYPNALLQFPAAAAVQQHGYPHQQYEFPVAKVENGVNKVEAVTKVEPEEDKPPPLYNVRDSWYSNGQQQHQYQYQSYYSDPSPVHAHVSSLTFLFLFCIHLIDSSL